MLFIGQIEEAAFVDWIKKMPKETLSDILDFCIVPPALNEEAQQMFNERRADNESNVRKASNKIGISNLENLIN